MRSFVLVCALALALLASCGTPQNFANINAWVATHVTVVHRADIPGRTCGGYGNTPPTIQLDDSCGTGDGWYYAHEVGHALDAQVFGYLRGQGVGSEQTAQCVAEVLTGRSPGYSAEDIAAGYWDCPDYEVARVRNTMIAAGVW